MVVIDGRHRVNCCRHAVEALNDHGVILFDDSNRDGYKDGYSFLRMNGFETADTPITLFLHGSGSAGNDNMAQVAGMGNLGKAFDKLAKDASFKLIVPQCPMSNMWVDVDYGSGEFDFNKVNAHANCVDEVIDSIKHHFPSLKKINVIGFSIGGFAAWYLIYKYPNLINKALIIAGGEDPDYVDVNKGISVTMIHGKDDNVVSPSGMKRLREVYSSSPHRYEEIKGKGHSLVWDMDVKYWIDILGEVINFKK